MTSPGYRTESEPVAVVVATYNSARFVVETLESIKAQSYPNLELVVTDDASTDNTRERVEAWVSTADNRGRFSRVQLLFTDRNTGVSGNCNRGIRAVSANWIKLIAGDDILLPNCIDDNMRFIGEDEHRKVVFSRVRNYRDAFVDSNYAGITPQQAPFYCVDASITAQDQHKLLLLGDRINYSPSCFLNREAIISVGGYDESERNMEDYPMWLKLTKAGYRLFFMGKETVGYRRHESASTNTGKSVLFKPSILVAHKFRIKNVHSHLPWDIVWRERFSVGISYLFSKAGLNRDTVFIRQVYALLTVYCNPFAYAVSFKKRILNRRETDILYRY